MRHPDWAKRLGAAIDGAQGKPFEWGVHDCCTFAAQCAREVAAIDLFAGIKWTNERSAAKATKAYGGFVDYFDKKLERIENPLFMQRGDIALIDNHGRLTVTVCTGASLVSPGIDGIEAAPISAASHAWKVK